MRHLNTLVTSTMDDSEKFMINYQKCHTIALSSEENDSSEGVYDGVPKMFDKDKSSHELKVNTFMVNMVTIFHI